MYDDCSECGDLLPAGASEYRRDGICPDCKQHFMKMLAEQSEYEPCDGDTLAELYAESEYQEYPEW